MKSIAAESRHKQGVSIAVHQGTEGDVGLWTAQ